MKKLFLVLACMAGCIVMTSCFGGGSKSDKVIDQFEDLVEEVEAKKGKLTVEEWKKMEEDFNKRFEALGIDELNEEDFSAMEKLKLAGLTIRWGVAMAESSGTLMEGMIEEAQKQQETENNN